MHPAVRLARLRLLFHRRIAVALATEDDLLAAVYRHYHASEGEGAPSPLAAALLAQQLARFGEVLRPVQSDPTPMSSRSKISV